MQTPPWLAVWSIVEAALHACTAAMGGSFRRWVLWTSGLQVDGRHSCLQGTCCSTSSALAQPI